MQKVYTDTFILMFTGGQPICNEAVYSQYNEFIFNIFKSGSKGPQKSVPVQIL